MVALIISFIVALGGVSPTEMAAYAQEQQAAIEACLEYNAVRNPKLDMTYGDGQADILVWLTTKDGEVLLCNANEKGQIYFNETFEEDITDGLGAEWLSTLSKREQFVLTANMHSPRSAKLCYALALPFLSPWWRALGQVWIDWSEDGHGNTIVWVNEVGHSTWACNASDNLKVHIFVELGDFLNVGEPM